jgi:hypothetical protein
MVGVKVRDKHAQHRPSGQFSRQFRQGRAKGQRWPAIAVNRAALRRHNGAIGNRPAVVEGNRFIRPAYDPYTRRHAFGFQRVSLPPAPQRAMP